MITGITIQYLNKVETGIDAFGRPIYEESAEDVENVVVGQPTSTEQLEIYNLTGRQVAYTLHIPKGDTHNWENVEVILPAPFAGRYRSFGMPVSYIEANVPLAWNTKVQVERFG